MKIIGGGARGRRLSGPARGHGAAAPIRPTSARAREALFSILGPLVADATVLDLFAGTGAMGLEALSRGARLAVFVDAGRPAIELIKKNTGLLGAADRSTIVRRDLTRGLSFLETLRPAEGFHLIFIDPPYRLGVGQRILAELARRQMLHPQGLIIMEHTARQELPATAGDLVLVDQRRYGEAGFGFYRKGAHDG